MAEDPASLQFLIADDSPDVRALYRLHLTTAFGPNAVFAEASCGTEVLELALSRRPSCVLLDYYFRDIDGLVVLEQLGVADVRCGVVMLSSVGNEAVVAEAMKRGAHDYVAKASVTPNRLATVVRNAMARAELSAELAREHVDLAATVRELRATASATTRLMATISHEIRTPLNGIVGLAQLLHDAELPEQERDLVTTLQRCADDLLVIVNDTLDFARIDSGRFPIEHIAYNPIEVAEQVVSLFEPTASGKQVALTLQVESDVPTGLIGDPVRLRQILNNLVSNALKFTSQGSVSLRLSADVANGIAMLRGRVVDTGCGMPPDVLESIFSPFNQASTSTARQFGGTGLGLAICSRLCDLLGGSISARSDLGKGSAFEFEIKNLVASDASTVKPRTGGHRVIASVTTLPVLLVDDNHVNRMVAEKMLEKLGFEVELAADGVQAVSAVRQRRFCLVLMDCQMPVLDGIEATRKIRAAEEHGVHVPIIAMTASADAEQRAACFDAGMDGFISKPVPQRELVDVLLAHLRPSTDDADQSLAS